MNRFTLGLKLLKNNLKGIIIFEAIYKVTLMALVTPVLVELVDIAMRLSGINYLTNARLVGFLLRPTTIAILVLVVVIYGIFMIMEMGALTYAYNISYNGGDASVVEMIKAGIFSAAKLISPYNLPMVIYVIAMIPITYFGTFSTYFGNMQIYAFVVEYLKYKPEILLIVLILIAILIFFAIKWINVMNYYITEKMNFSNATKASKRLNKGQYIGLVDRKSVV